MKNLTDKEINSYIAKLKADKNYHGFLCNTEVTKKWNNKKFSKYIRQHMRHGFDDTELWGLHQTIARFAVPRLKKFKKILTGHPAGLTEAEWNQKLDDYIWALSWDESSIDDFEEWKRQTVKQDEIVADFGKYFLHLWD